MENAISALKALKGSVLVLTHHNADIDAIASAVSLALCLRQRGVSARVGVGESVSRQAKKLAEGRDILVDPDCSKFDHVVVVDTSSPEQLASVKNLRVDILIDHHEPGKLAEKAKAALIDSGAKSASQIVLDVVKRCGFAIGGELAKLLMAGIIADTAHMRLAGKAELEALIELIGDGASIEEVVQMIETPVDESERVAGLKAAMRAEAYKLDDIIIVFSKLASHEAAACRALVKAGADIAVVAAVKKDEIRISSRGRQTIEKYAMNLADVFREVGGLVGGSGGGHAQAGSANGTKPGEVHKAFALVLKYAEKKTGKKARKLE
ncbi:MAG: DHH family phosphoesterase [Candidatus Aenigmatarchaeota archaeon]